MWLENEQYQNIIGTDDSLTLAEYLLAKGKAELPLSEIFRDTGLSNQNWDFRVSTDLAFFDAEGNGYDFYYAMDLIADLALLLLESKKNGGFHMKYLLELEDETCDLFVTITSTPAEDAAMDRVLADFSANALDYDLHEMVDEEELLAMAQTCEAIRQELRA